MQFTKLARHVALMSALLALNAQGLALPVGALTGAAASAPATIPDASSATTTTPASPPSLAEPPAPAMTDADMTEMESMIPSNQDARAIRRLVSEATGVVGNLKDVSSPEANNPVNINRRLIGPLAALAGGAPPVDPEDDRSDVDDAVPSKRLVSPLAGLTGGASPADAVTGGLPAKRLVGPLAGLTGGSSPADAVTSGLPAKRLVGPLAGLTGGSSPADAVTGDLPAKRLVGPLAGLTGVASGVTDSLPAKRLVGPAAGLTGAAAPVQGVVGGVANGDIAKRLVGPLAGLTGGANPASSLPVRSHEIEHASQHNYARLVGPATALTKSGPLSSVTQQDPDTYAGPADFAKKRLVSSSVIPSFSSEKSKLPVKRLSVNRGQLMLPTGGKGIPVGSSAATTPDGTATKLPLKRLISQGIPGLDAVMPAKAAAQQPATEAEAITASKLPTAAKKQKHEHKKHATSKATQRKIEPVQS